MATPHIRAEKGDIAEKILLPGDPLRAKFISENFYKILFSLTILEICLDLLEFIREKKFQLWEQVWELVQLEFTPTNLLNFLM